MIAGGTVTVVLLIRSICRRNHSVHTGKVEMVGRPEFWQTANDVNPAAFKAANDLGALFQKLRSKPVRGELPVALARIMTVTFNSFGAVTTLLLNGYDSDAMRIVRGMFENEVTGAYVRLHPELV